MVTLKHRVVKNPNVAIQVKIYEVSRTKLRRLGVDWAFFGPDFSAASSFADIIQSFSSGVGGSASGASSTFSAEVIGDGRRFAAFIEALEQHNMAKYPKLTPLLVLKMASLVSVFAASILLSTCLLVTPWPWLAIIEKK